MTAMRIKSGSRLHFGLLGWGPELPRQFGGVGLMIEKPGLEIMAENANDWQARGPLASRCLQVAHRVAEQLQVCGTDVAPLAFEIEQIPEEHTGLGVGTQLSLAVARLITQQAGLAPLPATDLAQLTGRGRRSGIGLHGFDRGGLIVDGGHGPNQGPPPLLSALSLPTHWNILLVTPKLERGCHGPEERSAFETMPAVPLAIHERLCRLVITGILPAVVEADLETFGAALKEFQEYVGSTFASAQGGTFAHPKLAELAHAMNHFGFHGVGQSSWGPTLYGFTRQTPEDLNPITQELQVRFKLKPEEFLWTRAQAGPATLAGIK